LRWVIEGLVGVRARVGGLRVATILSPSLLYGCLYSYSLGTREVFEVTRLRQIDREMSSSLFPGLWHRDNESLLSLPQVTLSGWIDFSTVERRSLGNNITALSANWLNPTSDSRKLARIYSTPTLIVHQRSCHPPLVLLNHLLTPDHDAGSQHAYPLILLASRT
jgi:hypothetical protein